MRALKVLTAELTHETNTFCKFPTTLSSFVERAYLLGDAAVAARGHANTPLAGFLDVGRMHDWNVLHVLSADAQPGGPVTRAAFDALIAPIIAAAKAVRADLGGVLLGLHGAMVTDFCEDGEGELLHRLREQIGPSVVIGITLDPHANVSRKMCDLANIMVSYKTYPHVDMRLAGRHAAEILQRAMTGDIHPFTLRVSRPMLEEVNGGRTDIGPMIERLAQARRYEQEADVFAVSVNGGFANADIAEVGPTVLVTAQGDMVRHARFAAGLADDIWVRRNQPLNEYLTVTQAAAICANYFSPSTKPIVVADYADNPGGGAYGDSTDLLAALLDAGVNNACYGAMTDPETVQQLGMHLPGDTVQVRLGGKTDARFGGGPLMLQGTLISLSNGHYVGSGAMVGGLQRTWGPTAVIQVDGIEILVVSLRGQVLDLEQFKAFGIDPEKKNVVALKSMQHFRAAFEPIAGQVIVCDSGALCTLNYARLPFARVPRPLFPFDPDLDMDRWMQSNNQGVYIPCGPTQPPPGA
jgi:microcystin degradation protein MlrC